MKMRTQQHKNCGTVVHKESSSKKEHYSTIGLSQKKTTRKCSNKKSNFSHKGI